MPKPMPRLTRKQMQKLKPKLSLKAQAIQCLARRDYSRAELRSRLLLKNIPKNAEAEAILKIENELDFVLDELATKNLLDDARFLAQTVDRKKTRFGAARILRELKPHGLDEGAVLDVQAGLKETELERCVEVWQRKFNKNSADINLGDYPKYYVKQVRFLASRGFSGSAISATLKQYKH